MTVWNKNSVKLSNYQEAKKKEKTISIHEEGSAIKYVAIHNNKRRRKRKKELERQRKRVKE